jgi:four helix bundle protein
VPRNVEGLQVFQKARTAAKAIFETTARSPLARDRDLASQLNRAAVRVVSDIAEGFEQKTDRHFARFLFDSRGSANEIRTQLLIAADRRHNH